MIITSPDNMSIEDWIGAITVDLSPVAVPIYKGSWRKWVAELDDITLLPYIPDTTEIIYEEDEWQKWAYDFIGNLVSLNI